MSEMNWEQRKRNSYAACLERMAPGLLSGRKQKMTEVLAEAQRLVDERAVHIMSRDDVCIEGRVGRNEQGRAYHTFVFPDGTAACNCPHGRFRRTTDLCAHALAVKLTVEKEG